MKSAELSKYLDRILKTEAIQDDSLNGLQVGNRSDVCTVAFAVDASGASILKAKENGAQFLLVHHGLFWGKPARIVGHVYECIRLCIEMDMALYASHLPLDLHPQFGNNARIVRMMGWNRSENFGEYHGQAIGKSVRLPRPILLSDLADTMRKALGCEPTVWNFGDRTVRRVAVISGGALSMVGQLERAGLDTLITGEPEHAHYWNARGCKLNVLFGGHYLTETLGLKALQSKIKKDTKLNTAFLDIPTGY